MCVFFFHKYTCFTYVDVLAIRHIVQFTFSPLQYNQSETESANNTEKEEKREMEVEIDMDCYHFFVADEIVKIERKTAHN